jgi:hypothetical protein
MPVADSGGGRSAAADDGSLHEAMGIGVITADVFGGDATAFSIFTAGSAAGVGV